MAKLIVEPLRLRCAKCSALAEYEIGDYFINKVGHGPPDGFRCPACGAPIPVRFKMLPVSWQDVLKDKID